MEQFPPDVQRYIENLRLRYRQEALQAIEQAKSQGYEEGLAKGLADASQVKSQDSSALEAEIEKWKRLYSLKMQDKSDIESDDCVLLVKHVMERSYTAIRSNMQSFVENDKTSNDPKHADKLNGVVKQSLQSCTRNLLNQLPPIILLTPDIQSRLTSYNNSSPIDITTSNFSQFSVQEYRLFPPHRCRLSYSLTSRSNCISFRFFFGLISEKRDGILGSRYMSYEASVTYCQASTPFLLMAADGLTLPRATASLTTRSSKSDLVHCQDSIVDLTLPSFRSSVTMHQVDFHKRFRDFEELYIALTTGSQLNSYPTCKHPSASRNQMLRHRLAWRAQQCVIPLLPSKDVYVSANPNQDLSILTRQIDLSEWILFLSLHPVLQRHVSVLKFMNGNNMDLVPVYWREMMYDPQADSLGHTRHAPSKSTDLPVPNHMCVENTNWILEEDEANLSKSEARDKVKRRISLISTRIDARIPSQQYLLDASIILCASLEKNRQCLAEVLKNASLFASFHCKTARKTPSSSTTFSHVDQQYRFSDMSKAQEMAIRRSFLSLGGFTSHSLVPSFQERIELIDNMIADPVAGVQSTTVVPPEASKSQSDRKSISNNVVEVELAPILARVLVSEWSSYEVIRSVASVCRFKWLCQEMLISSKWLHTSWRDVSFQFSRDNYNFLISPSLLLPQNFQLWDIKMPKMKNYVTSKSETSTRPMRAASNNINEQGRLSPSPDLTQQTADRPMMPESVRRLPTRIMSAIWSAITPIFRSSFGWNISESSSKSLLADDHFVVQPSKPATDEISNKHKQRNDSEESQGYSTFHDVTEEGFVRVSDDDYDDEPQIGHGSGKQKNRTISRSVSPSRQRQNANRQGFKSPDVPVTVGKPRGKKKTEKALYSAMFEEDLESSSDNKFVSPPEPVLQKTRSEASTPVKVQQQPESVTALPSNPTTNQSWIKARPPSQRILRSTKPAAFDSSSQSKSISGSASASVEEDLPSGWSTVVMDDGRRYYYHNVTRISRWDKPSSKVVQEIEKQVQAGINAFESRKKEMDDNQKKVDEAVSEKEALRPRIASIVDDWIGGAVIKGTRRRNVGPITSPSTTVEEVDLVILLKTIPRYLSFVDEELVSVLQRSRNPEASHVKRCYFSIVRFIHPDKLVGKSLEDKMLAESFFTIIASEFDDYRDKHKLN